MLKKEIAQVEHWFHTDEQMEFLDNWLKHSI